MTSNYPNSDHFSLFFFFINQECARSFTDVIACKHPSGIHPGPVSGPLFEQDCFITRSAHI